MSYVVTVRGGTDVPSLFRCSYRSDPLSPFLAITGAAMQIRTGPATTSLLLATFKSDGTGQGQITGDGTTEVNFSMTAAQTTALVAAARPAVPRSFDRSPLHVYYDVYGTTAGVRRCLLDGTIILESNVTGA